MRAAAGVTEATRHGLRQAQQRRDEIDIEQRRHRQRQEPGPDPAQQRIGAVAPRTQHVQHAQPRHRHRGQPVQEPPVLIACAARVAGDGHGHQPAQHEPCRDAGPESCPAVIERGPAGHVPDRRRCHRRDVEKRVHNGEKQRAARQQLMRAHNHVRSRPPRDGAEPAQQEELGEDHRQRHHPRAARQFIGQRARRQALHPRQRQRQQHEDQVERDEHGDGHGGKRASRGEERRTGLRSGGYTSPAHRRARDSPCGPGCARRHRAAALPHQPAPPFRPPRPATGACAASQVSGSR